MLSSPGSFQVHFRKGKKINNKNELSLNKFINSKSISLNCITWLWDKWDCNNWDPDRSDPDKLSTKTSIGKISNVWISIVLESINPWDFLLFGKEGKKFPSWQVTLILLLGTIWSDSQKFLRRKIFSFLPECIENHTDWVFHKWALFSKSYRNGSSLTVWFSIHSGRKEKIFLRKNF